MPDLKLGPILEVTQLKTMRPVLAGWFGEAIDRVRVEGTRLQAPDRYWITYAAGERRLTLKVYFETERYENARARMARLYPERLGRLDHPRGGLLLLPEMNGLLWSFPFDPAMPRLDSCFNGAWIGGLLAGPLQRSAEEPLLVSVVSYSPEIGILLAYCQAGGGKPIAYGKCSAKDKSGFVYAAMQHLWQSPGRLSGRLSLARPLAYWPEAGLLLQAPAQGAPLPPDRNRQLFLDLVQRAGSALAAIHTSGISDGPERLLEEPAGLLRRSLTDVAHTAPALYPSFQWLVRRLDASPESDEPILLAPSHGDFKWEQFLEHEGRFSLIDFELFCLAEPELDLGTFCAYLYPAQSHDWRDGAVAGMLRAAFLQAYDQGGGLSVKPVRLARYEAVALALRALGFIWQYQEDWQWQAAQLLEIALDRLVDPMAVV